MHTVPSVNKLISEQRQRCRNLSGYIEPNKPRLIHIRLAFGSYLLTFCNAVLLYKT